MTRREFMEKNHPEDISGVYAELINEPKESK